VEQAATNTVTGIFAQLGIAGLILAVLIAGAVWYLKASRDLRDEKRSVIGDLRTELEKVTKDRDKYLEELLDCRYPGRKDGQ